MEYIGGHWAVAFLPVCRQISSIQPTKDKRQLKPSGPRPENEGIRELRDACG